MSVFRAGGHQENLGGQALQLIGELISRFLTWSREEAGQTLVEYALIIALVSIALVVALGALATGIDGVFSDIIGQF